MEEFLTGSGTIGVFAIFGLLCLREVLQYRRNGKDNGNGNNSIKEAFTRVERLVDDRAKKSADLHAQTARILQHVSDNIIVQTERLTQLSKGQEDCRNEMRRTVDSARRPKAH